MSLTYSTRIPSGIWSHLYGSFLSALNTYCLLAAMCERIALNTWSKVWPWILIWAY